MDGDLLVVPFGGPPCSPLAFIGSSSIPGGASSRSPVPEISLTHPSLQRSRICPRLFRWRSRTRTRSPTASIRTSGLSSSNPVRTLVGRAAV